MGSCTREREPIIIRAKIKGLRTFPVEILTGPDLQPVKGAGHRARRQAGARDKGDLAAAGEPPSLAVCLCVGAGLNTFLS